MKKYNQKIVSNNSFTEFLIYTAPNGKVKVEIFLRDENIWLTQAKIAELFGIERSVVTKHLQNIFREGELDRNLTCAKIAQVQSEGQRQVSRDIEFYNLDAILSVGYRVNSAQATQFRIWATERLKEYIIKGFTMDDERLKNLGGGNYWKELLEAIRDIRSSEKVLYRQVLDLYATAIDYDPQADDSFKFFKTVQNKLHFAAHGHTAAEVIYFRVDSDKPFAGLTNFKGKQPTQAEAMIAKNFLELSELKVLNNLVSAYFDLAEINALEQKSMSMKDYIRELDNILKSTGRKLLDGAGKISHDQATEKANLEYRNYKAKNLSEVEKAYLGTIKVIGKKIATTQKNRVVRSEGKTTGKPPKSK